MDSALYMCACCVELRTRVALYTVGLINRSLCACASDEDECFLARFVVVVVVAWYYINRFGFVEKKAHACARALARTCYLTSGNPGALLSWTRARAWLAAHTSLSLIVCTLHMRSPIGCAVKHK